MYRRFPSSFVSLSSLFVLCTVLFSCQTEPPARLDEQSLIPLPVSVTATDSTFELTRNTAIYVPEGNEEAQKIGQFLADWLKVPTGLTPELKSAAQVPSGHIALTLTPGDAELGEEGYVLSITAQGIRLAAAKPAGLFRGIQTLRQALPARMEADHLQKGPWLVPTGTIRDYPTYPYRGAMLDVARHFFGVDDVKRYIDLIAAYKMNALHLHLADDQGWRIEIKSWPNLTAHGSKSAVGGAEGGFYTQEQYSELVRYAQDRYITLIPEIDMPGHTNAALASYPELNCDGKAPELYTGIEVGFSTLCTSKEITYKFVDDVVRELAALTPGPYIHLGGDESHVTKMEDYIPFVNRVQDIVQAHGKQMIGWDEITNANLKPTTVAQFWAKAEYAKSAAERNVKLIVSPAKKAYLDMQYDSTSKYGLHWAAYIEVDSAYSWDPATMVPGVTKEHILGIEAPLWTETLTKIHEVEYMVFPRMPGLAEIGWTPAAARSWDEYKVRLGNHYERFKARGINFYESERVPWVKSSQKE